MLRRSKNTAKQFQQGPDETKENSLTFYSLRSIITRRYDRPYDETNKKAEMGKDRIQATAYYLKFEKVGAGNQRLCRSHSGVSVHDLPGRPGYQISAIE
uniref:Uncharacterized protein n=1 Tax=Angiostrongylus cantonensis TaxID=6313 RepID=A0A0K0CXK1_ANGCA